MKKNNAVYYWLIFGCVLIALMVVIGGITRLTQSGLSMVEWKPIVGAIPPLNEQEWNHEFELYKSSPEYKHYNSHFSLSDFKSIFFWEYLHRLIGRIIGLVFLIPCVVFWLKGKFSKELKNRVIIIFIGGLCQGIIGWLMVKSGLVKNPHVSHYRLALHLATALALIVYIYWTAMYVKHGNSRLKTVLFPVKYINGIAILISLQIVYGAFVAGLKAGKMYTTFPKMGDVWFPVELGTSFKDSGFLALTEAHSVVQLIHRLFGVSLFLIACYLLLILKKQHVAIVGPIRFLSLLIILQVVLGIFTLVLAVPVNLGVLHQSVAIIILLTIFQLKFRSKYNWN
jgi:cytochrome c oxidase assembly protein subunit 15